MTIRVEVKSIQQAVINAGRALNTLQSEINSGKTREENRHILKTVLPQLWRAEYGSDIILEWIPSQGLFINYVDFESEADRTLFLLRWS